MVADRISLSSDESAGPSRGGPGARVMPFSLPSGALTFDHSDEHMPEARRFARRLER